MQLGMEFWLLAVLGVLGISKSGFAGGVCGHYSRLFFV